MLWLGLGHDKEGRNEMTSCQRPNTKKRHKTEFATTKLFSFLARCHCGHCLSGALPPGGDRRYFNGNNFNFTSDLGFVVMTSQWPSHTVRSWHYVITGCHPHATQVTDWRLGLTMWLSILLLSHDYSPGNVSFQFTLELTVDVGRGEWDWLLPHNNRDPWNINISLVDVFIFHSPVSTLPVIPLLVLIA